MSLLVSAHVSGNDCHVLIRTFEVAGTWPVSIMSSLVDNSDIFLGLPCKYISDCGAVSCRAYGSAGHVWCAPGCLYKHKRRSHVHD